MRLYQGESADVVALLQQLSSGPAPVEQLVRQNLMLGIAQVRLGHAPLSRKALDAAEALHPQGELHAEMLAAEGSVALYQGRLAEAKRYFDACLIEAQQQHLTFLELQMWNNRASVAAELEHYEESVEYFSHATGIAQQIGARLVLEKSLANLSLIYFQTGDYARALQSGDAALSEAKAIGATLDEAQTLLNVGMSQLQVNDLDGARTSFERSLKLAQDLQSPARILNGHIALSYLLLRQQPAAAEVHIREAVRIAQQEQDPTRQVEPALLDALLQTRLGRDQEAEAELLELAKNTNASPSMQWAVENTLGTLYANANRSPDADRWFQRAIVTFHRQRLSLRSVELELPFLENGSDLYLGYMEHLIHTHRSADALRVLDQSRAETLAEGLGVATSSQSPAQLTSATGLAARLHGTVLVYCLRPKASYLWASTATTQRFYTLPGSNALLPLIARHTQAILASKDLLAQPDSPGRVLYDALVQPADALLPHNGRVFIIADRELSGLNFETLISPTGKPHYWIDDVTITNARSLRLLAASRQDQRPGARHAMLLIGNPVYRPQEYAALPNAAGEMTRVADHFRADHRAVFSGADATPPLYATADPGHFSYIHFVAHATANETNPLDSAIILSGPTGGSKLYARDILKRPLDADLVTISSCYGSGLRNYSGEGVVGLVWAFLRAGAHSVIGAMWEVSDVSTPQLMDTLYSRLLAGERPDAALRSAKLTLLHSDGVFRKPLYWASFQLYSGR